MSSENTSVLPALARVVRGLSAIFWGLPIALLATARTLLGEGPRVYFGTWGGLWGPWGRLASETVGACFVAIGAVGLVGYGLRRLRCFQPQESVWTTAINRALWSVTAVLGLVPFAHWWSRFPREGLFLKGVALLLLAGVFFGLAINHLLIRLAAMLPDEILRQDARWLSRINQVLLLLILLGAFASMLFQRWVASWPIEPVSGTEATSGQWLAIASLVHEQQAVLLLLGALLPVALTMTLVWKVKETIMAGVFRGG